MADEIEKVEEEPKEPKKNWKEVIGIIVGQMMKVVASIGFGIIVGTFIYTQGDQALEYILQFIMQNASEPAVTEDPFSQGGIESLTDLITMRMLVSVGSGMIASVWFYNNMAQINLWLNRKLGLALNVNFFKKKADLDKE